MPQSLLLLLLIIGSVAVCIRLKTGGPMIGLFFSWIIIIYLFCKVLKIDYDHVVGGSTKFFSNFFRFFFKKVHFLVFLLNFQGKNGQFLHFNCQKQPTKRKYLRWDCKTSFNPKRYLLRKKSSF